MAAWLVHLLLVCLSMFGTNAKYFPKIKNFEKESVIRASSTCGRISSNYCTADSVSTTTTCNEKQCMLSCCDTCHDTSPSAENMAKRSKIDTFIGDAMPGETTKSVGFNATKNSKIIIRSLPGIDHQNTGFTISVWVKQTKDNLGTLFSKTITKAPYSIIYAIILKNTDLSIQFHYIAKGSSTSERIIITPLLSQLPKDVGDWQHVTVTVLSTGVSYFLNGVYVGTDQTLKNVIGEQDGAVRVGEVYQGKYKYDGLMQDIFFYERVLTNREITEVYSGAFPSTNIKSECRCPPTHPKLSIKHPAKCAKNTDKVEGDIVSRLSKTSHPIEYVTDGESSSYWLSEITNNVVITMDLLYGLVQVSHVIFEFYGKQPMAYIIEKSTDHGSTYQPWQYYADSCTKSFDMVNNGAFSQPDTVICKKSDSSSKSIPFLPYIRERLSDGNCQKLHCSPKLLDFIEATHIRLHFYNHSSNLPEKAKYFGLYQLTVTGRCDCHGNANNAQYIARNITNNGSCVCDCVDSTNTEGTHCDRCKPLYNNKPFKRSHRITSYPCVKCDCNNHATSCYYNATLDTNPTSRTQGAGGVCIDCQHHTTGRYCHECQQGFYRDYEKSLKDPDVCVPCKCNGPGVKPGVNKCVKDNSDTGISPGQCDCKANVSGLLCDQCKPGFYGLNKQHTTGCISCDCDVRGTENGSSVCDTKTGQCLCKAHVFGQRCDQCKATFFNLAENNTDGCEPCLCSKIGSQNMMCDRDTGNCLCKTKVVGRRCDRCDLGYHSLDKSGCKQCSCSGLGTETKLAQRCEQVTGKCVCKAYATGFNCDRCKVGYFKLSVNNEFGCTKCPCNKNGTVTNTNICHNITGDCTCKRNVTGVNCDTCPLGYFNLSSANKAGCERCQCHPKGTIDGSNKSEDELSCDKTTGKCSCLNGVQGLKCDKCKHGYVWNRDGEGCVHCNCHINGSTSISCNNNGTCDCKPGIGGQFCDRCISGYHSFNKLKGSCIKCDCNLAGVERNECDAHGCQLSCKANVQGKRCDTCKPGTDFLKKENPFGCSGALSQQGAPTVGVMSSRVLRVTWDPPDKPNGLITSYVLYRNNTKIYTGLKRSYEDTGLLPYTIYSYHIITSNDYSSLRSLSDGKVYRTSQDIPTGIGAPIISEVTSRTGKATWSKPARINGVVTKYVIESTNTRDPSTIKHYDGLFVSCYLANLRPYTTYNFTLRACTVAGCASSPIKQVNTPQSAPDSQPAPVVIPLRGGRQFSITWDEPATPNGVINIYKVYERSQPFVADNRGTEIYSYQPLFEGNKYRNMTRTGLQPFTFYEYRIAVFTVARTMSNWTRQRTAEDVPTGEHGIQPTSYAVSSSHVNITWIEPRSPNGYIKESRIFMYTKDTNYSMPSLILTVNDSLTTLISHLQPFTTYKFTVITCNSVGCTGHSDKTQTKTLAAAPSGQNAPSGHPVNSSYTSIAWQPPSHPNGPLSLKYHLLRANAALHYPPINAVEGAHFPGFGYYKLPNTVIPAGSTTSIDFWFRTQYQDGLMVLLASSGDQEDYLAIELHGGKVYLIFNCGTGKLVLTVNTTGSLSDDRWHSLRVSRIKRKGTLIVDDQFLSTGESNERSTIIDTNTGVYIGGVNFDDFKATTELSNSIYSLKNRKYFIGCLKNVRLQNAKVDFSAALDKTRVDPLSNGCPQGVDPGVHLKGGGYMSLKKGVFIGKKLVGYTLKFEFRTQHNTGLLLFTYGEAPHHEYLAVLLSDGDIQVYYQTAKEHGNWSVTMKQDLCDGAWHELEFVNFGAESFVLNIDNTQAQIVKPIRVLKVSSELYFGGVPHNSPAADRLKKLGLQTHAIFGGCIRNVRTSREVIIQNDISVAENADLSGCPRNVQLKVHATCQTPSSTLVYTGGNTTTVDSNLAPFTDYLYRVESRQADISGSGKSPWVVIRSGDGAPVNIPAPRVEALIGGRTINASWSPPEIYNGILRRYQIRAYNMENTSVNVVSKTNNDVDIFQDIIPNLVPYTIYNITVTAFTNGGSGESAATQLTTLQSVPEDVIAPEVDRYPYHLFIHWRAPLRPNGVITSYSLMVDSKMVHCYLNQTFNMTGLTAYSKHELQLTACTKIGCSKSSSVMVYTAEIAPDQLSPPYVTIRDSRSAEVRWQEPGINNGKMIGYRVTWVQKYDVTQRGHYNSSVTEKSYLVRNLTAGTWYNFYITAINGGGSTRSSPTSRRTVESSPEKIPAPLVRGLTPYSILVTIREPLLPNGNITRYELYEVRESDEVLVMNGSLRNYTKTGLLPYSAHSYRTAACTVKGCGTSDIGRGYTLEIAPNGSISLNITILNDTSVLAQWTTIHTPNGALRYGLIVEGLFLIDQTKFVFQNTTRVVASVAHVHNTWSQELVYTGLLPYTTFRFQMNASNSVGYILSNSVYGETKEGAPIGLSRPNVTILNSTAAHVTWLPAARDNGVLQYYKLIRVNLANNQTTMVNTSLELSMVMVDLEPYTLYQFQIAAVTRGGVAYSLVTMETTDEDIPEQIDPPSVADIDSRSMLVKWNHPTTPNGHIIHYLLYKNNVDGTRISNNITNITITGLEPYTRYYYIVAACTVIGCSNSSRSRDVWTLQDVPEGQQPPSLSHSPGPSVFIQWLAPNITNGILSEYEIQRRSQLDARPVSVQKINANLSKSYIDERVSPCTQYSYRVVAFTAKGAGTPSSWSNITTLEGAPDTMRTPLTSSINSTAIYVLWFQASSRCTITHYIIRVLNNNRNYTDFKPTDDRTYTITDLLPYTEYNIVVSACTSTACRDSAVSTSKTGVSIPRHQPPPTATPLTSTSLRVKWNDPMVPAGIITNFLLYRRTLDEPLSENFTAESDYTLIYPIGNDINNGLRRTFDDTGLAVFSAHQYKVMVVNKQGNTTSNESEVFRTGGVPPRAGVLLHGRAENHTSVYLNWTLPELKLLLGFVQSYEVLYKDLSLNREYAFTTNLPGVKTSVVVTHLKPSRRYEFTVVLNNGAGTFPSNKVQVRTLDGVPEGFDMPAVRTINSTTIEVVWSEPRTPNGKITEYNIYANGGKRATTNDLSHNLTSLIPFTVYKIQVEVCTVYACVKSQPNNAKTLASVPRVLRAPRLAPGRRNMVVIWEPPERPNGHMLEYHLYKIEPRPCPTKFCTYIECPIKEQLCGSKCYDPELKVCCKDVLYNKDPSKTCCDDNYSKKINVDDVCCGGQFYQVKDDHRCCHGYYQRVAAGRVCCQDKQGLPVIGDGNSCCGATPYDNSTHHCACGIKYDGRKVRQCCGGKVVAIAQVCCGGQEIDGEAYDYDKNKKCCGSKYIAKSSLCCKSNLGKYEVYLNPGVGDKCCGSKMVSSGLSCCNERGYNATTHSCADKSLSSDRVCGDGTICNKSSSTTALCNRCDFRNLLCDSVLGYYSPNNCGSHSVLLMTGNNTFLSYDVQHLQPYTTYSYYITARNHIGNVTGATATSKTLMDAPEGVYMPRLNITSATSIEIIWQTPKQSNGIIKEYRLTRIDQNTTIATMVYNGTSLMFTDHGLQPFTGYKYMLEACTSICANITTDKVEYTREAAPENVSAPILKALSAITVQITWSQPLKPNGKITHYIIRRRNETHDRIVEWNVTGIMKLVDDNKDLEPYTIYQYMLIACTKVGCTRSQSGSVRTLQAAPEAVGTPKLITRNSSAIEVIWSSPLKPNGIILWYAIYRDGNVVYNTSNVCTREKTCSYIDSGRTPHTNYTYTLEASTSAGITRSAQNIAKTPESSPEGIHIPTLLAKSFSSILVSWQQPSIPNGVIIKYSIIIGTDSEISVGIVRQYLVKNLQPFTEYSFRIKACTAKGCGVGDRGFTRTLEATPEQQPPPLVTALSDMVVKITWDEPRIPNGIITSYEVERKVSNQPAIVVYRTTLKQGLIWHTRNSGLQPYTNYSYRIRSFNKAGSVRSAWSVVQTMQGTPENIHPPIVHAINSTTILASWKEPGRGNGIITKYTLWTRPSNSIDDMTKEASSSKPEQNVTISGLKPNTYYEFQLSVSTLGGTGQSEWTLVQTLDAAPQGIGAFSVEKHVSGTELTLTWSVPFQPNGIITTYLVYSDGQMVCRGTTRKCHIPRRTPFTTYTFQLEACTSGGCNKGIPQTITTAEVPPQHQGVPALTSNSSYVELIWAPPLSPNGIITRYEVLRLDQTYSIYNTTNGNTTLYIDYNVKPYTKYQYEIRVHNSVGSTQSPTVTIMTDQGPPHHVEAPNVVPKGSSTIQVSWLAPVIPNGIITSYLLRRNGSVIGHWSKRVLPQSYTDLSLAPATWYSYQVTACTIGGCTESMVVLVKTGSSTPGAVKPPSLIVLSSTSIKVQWQPPVISNGVVRRYELYRNSVSIYKTQETLTFYDTALQAFTSYRYTVTACTDVGCTPSEESLATTLEAIPEGLEKPSYIVIGAKIIEIEWTPPHKPNGIIKYYVLYRNDSVIYNGTGRRFYDKDIKAYSYYKYVVMAANSAGSINSVPLYTNRTSPGTPENIGQPTLVPISDTQIQVSWQAPSKPNGIITEYHVLYNNIQVNVGLHLAYLAENLKYFTVYNFTIRACTSRPPCAQSPPARARTLEGPPLGQEAPTISDIGARTIVISWSPPSSPNGIMKGYILKRRSSFVEIVVYNGSMFTYNDTKLTPHEKYHYRVIGYNSKDMTSSPWSTEITTLSSIPENVLPPLVSDVTATMFKITIQAPGKPNGVITNYVIEVNQKNVSEGIKLERIVKNLHPFTDYKLRVFACTIKGCGGSEIIAVKTGTSTPGNVEEIQFGEVTATSIVVLWQPPTKPNGVITRYLVAYKGICSQSCIRKRNVDDNVVIDVELNTSLKIVDLKPYTKYHITIQVENKNYKNSGEPVEQRTKASDPEYISKPIANITGHIVLIDWSKSFDLNGPLLEYILYENERMIFRGLGTNSESLPDRTDSEFIYVVSATTTVEGVRKTVKSAPLNINVSGASKRVSDDSAKWFRSIWFLVLISLFLILVVFGMVAYCLRKTSGDRTVYIREQDPLPLRPKSRHSTPMSLASNYTPSEAYFNMVDINPETRSQASTVIGEPDILPKYDWEGYVPYAGDDAEWLDEEKSWSDDEPEKSTKYLVFPDTHL